MEIDELRAIEEVKNILGFTKLKEENEKLKESLKKRKEKIKKTSKQKIILSS